MAKFCTGCGAPLSEDKKFCTECGAPVTAVEESTAVENVELAAAEVAAEETVAPEAPKPQPQPAQPQQAQPQAAYQQPNPQPAYQQAQTQAIYQQAQPQAAYRQPQPNPQPVYQQPVQARTVPVTPAAPVYGADIPPAKGSKYEPITAWGYIGIMLLMCIPIVGIVLTIIWACGGCRKVNKRSLARASLIMMAVGFVISLIMGFVLKGVMNSAIEASGLGEVAAIEGSAAEGEETESTVIQELLGGNSNSGETSDQNENENSELSGLAGLLGLLGGISGEGNSNNNSNVTNSNIQELQELETLLEGLESAGGGDTSGLEGLIDGAIAANQEAEVLNDGWPKTLRPYPDGTATALASYRTEISDTSKETMHQWIEDLKGDGFEFQDFYDFGFSEEDMLGMDAWWGYDGNTYLSVSYYEGVVTIDHTKELPDLESYFGG